MLMGVKWPEMGLGRKVDAEDKCGEMVMAVAFPVRNGSNNNSEAGAA